LERTRQSGRQRRPLLLIIFIDDADPVVCRRRVGGQAVPIRDARASLEEYGQLRERVTATRLAALGVFALASKKKVDDRELMLIVETDDPDVGFTAQVKDVLGARELVRRINAESRRPVDPYQASRVLNTPYDDVPVGDVEWYDPAIEAAIEAAASRHRVSPEAISDLLEERIPPAKTPAESIDLAASEIARSAGPGKQ
jgi:hypothetical protein